MDLYPLLHAAHVLSYMNNTFSICKISFYPTPFVALISQQKTYNIKMTIIWILEKDTWRELKVKIYILSMSLNQKMWIIK